VSAQEAAERIAANARALLGEQAPELPFRSIAELCAEVDAAGTVAWLIRGLWPADAYGVLGADPKVGKTWLALDLAVAVASGSP
jgi:AAA domain